MAQSLTLVCVTLPIVRLRVSAENLVVGRSSRCDLMVSDATVSRRHARVRCVREGLIIEDLGSRNGTFIGGERVRKGLAVVGSYVRFGQLDFQVLKSEELDDSARETEQAGVAAKQTQSNPLVEPVLSDAQQRVFELLFTGCREKEIAKRLGLSHHTVHNHIKSIYRIYGVHSRTELLAAALRLRQGRPEPKEPQ
jgi:DNA-binding CsgD family transcriptional regulator